MTAMILIAEERRLTSPGGWSMRLRDRARTVVTGVEVPPRLPPSRRGLAFADLVAFAAASFCPERASEAHEEAFP